MPEIPLEEAPKEQEGKSQQHPQNKPKDDPFYLPDKPMEVKRLSK